MEADATQTDDQPTNNIPSEGIDPQHLNDEPDLTLSKEKQNSIPDVPETENMDTDTINSDERSSNIIPSVDVASSQDQRPPTDQPDLSNSVNEEQNSVTDTIQSENVEAIVIKTEDDPSNDPVEESDQMSTNIEYDTTNTNIGSNVTTEVSIDNVRKKQGKSFDGVAVTMRVDLDDSLSIFGRSNRAKIKREFTCYECFQTFTTQTIYDDHMATHRDAESYKCPTCRKTFHSKTGVLNHMRIHIASQKRIYKCSVCDITFDTNKDLKEHKSVHTGVIFRCSLAKRCSELTFKDHCEYWFHELGHSTNPKPKCVECGTYINSGYMKTHILTHFDVKVKCKLCGALFSSEQNLKNHMNRHDFEVTCVECGKVFKAKELYNKHMMVHTGVRKYQCLYCGKGFITSQQRNNHTMIHTDERPHKCNICGHRSRQKGDAIKHRQTHSNEKKFECDYCHKKFFHKWSVLSHIRSHTQSRIFSCTECDFTTTTRTGLRSHVTYKHLDARPYKCELCNVSFKCKNHIYRHNLSKMHRNKAYGAMKAKSNI